MTDIMVAVFLASGLLTLVVWRTARRLGLIDIPNTRSSHRYPTARGGGLAIYLTTVAAVLVLEKRGLAPHDLVLALVVGGTLVAAVGLVDDCRRLTARIRICVHVLAASLGLYFLGGMPPLAAGSFQWEWGFAGNLVGVLGLVWLVNLTNFMDGIDGIAAAEVAFATVAGGAVLAPAASGTAPAGCAITASCAGFLLLNRPPARIFMGDIGSGFLGYATGILMLAQARHQPAAIWTWLILLGVFETDATLTLIRRAAAGARIFEAHRSHAYQHAARRWGHLKVTSAVTIVNTLWLAPIACASALWPRDAVALLAAAIFPLAVIAFILGAGADPRAGSGDGVTAPAREAHEICS